jgi:hypothetical protein
MKIKLEMTPESSADVALMGDILGQIALKAISGGPDKVQVETKMPAPKPITMPAAPKPIAPKPAAMPLVTSETSAVKEAENTAPTELESIQATVQEKIGAGHRETIKTYLTEFGATKASNLQPEFYKEFHDKLKALPS